MLLGLVVLLVDLLIGYSKWIWLGVSIQSLIFAVGSLTYFIKFVLLGYQFKYLQYKFLVFTILFLSVVVMGMIQAFVLKGQHETAFASVSIACLLFPFLYWLKNTLKNFNRSRSYSMPQMLSTKESQS